MAALTYNMVTVLGATASGKTAVAAHLAKSIGGEIISADSRQVYKGMDIGTGKDLSDYFIDGTLVPYHLIDIAEAGYQYNVFEYQRDFLTVFDKLQKWGKFPVLCGGTGLYIEAILKGYKLIQVPVNEIRRNELQGMSLEELTLILSGYKELHNTSDIENKKRAVRAIEIEEYYQKHPEIDLSFPEINSLIVGVKFDRDSRRRRITQRLKDRLQNGMIEEVEKLLTSGLSPKSLTYYGLEYKYLTMYVTGDISYDEMFQSLNTAIHQFSKRQMTWFRKMEREGFHIHWLDGYMPLPEKIGQIKRWMQS
ncbi:tRNA (adenosine(37)-N6)-dimethylallyltransferase MiaA [Prolixibacter sp. SD074]|uniref:tRNA (adenosine(37)-N6)-dimethylallyltransferase MiaA n=1 Tax=Prolixibacter sp. SD074 TaxID=2652391 RepID=UPI0012749502|nr:tRNA (adenosine(37)-N6)-dimethylallyltransferase MiaA [Prolixibacter sp. SD074]GET27966.1 tRNA dimethylallyltransferase 2 [Prolixibacter sp. SD074]